MKNALISAQQVREEKYNSIVLNTENVSQFLAYYTLVLTLGVNNELINQSLASQVSDMILTWIRKDQDDNSILIANNMYLLTVYLQSMSTNVEQLNRLKMVTNPDEAKKLFMDVNQFLKQQVSKMKIKLSFIKKVIHKSKLNYEVINLTERDFENYVIELSHLSCNLKQLHKMSSLFTLYRPTKEYDSKDYITRLSNEIDQFLVELQILEKLEAKQIMETIQGISSIRTSNFNEFSPAEAEVKEIEKQIEDLKTHYKKLLNDAQEAENLIREKLFEIEEEDRKNFRAKNPELGEEEFEEAFEEWQDQQPDEHYHTGIEEINESRLNSEYEMKLTELNERLTEEERKLDEEDIVRNSEFADIGQISLEKVLIIAAMQVAAMNNPNVILPTTFEELITCLGKIKIKQAAQILLAERKIDFSDTERKYLEEL